ncbi:MAG: hypothetical protein SGCHY_000315 [Lobulomycetales sp.]
MRRDITFPYRMHVHVHVISPDGEYKGVSNRVIRNQLSIISKDYSGVFRFRLSSINRVRNSSWVPLEKDSVYEYEMKKTLRKGGKSTLNVYIANLEAPKLGWSTFPQDMERPDGLSLDGVVIHTDTLPQYSKKKPGYAEGRTLTHELYPNDLVTDTRPQKRSTMNSYGCPSAFKSCQAESFQNTSDRAYFERHEDHASLDLSANFMDWVKDRCMESFTRGQIERIKTNWVYRLLV